MAQLSLAKVLRVGESAKMWQECQEGQSAAEAERKARVPPKVEET